VSAPSGLAVRAERKVVDKIVDVVVWGRRRLLRTPEAAAQ
jgi:hypothetical protein